MGAAFALVLYGGYSLVSPVVSAWVIAPQSQIVAKDPGAARMASTEVSDDKYQRFVARSKQIYSRLAAPGTVPAQDDGTAVRVASPTMPPPPPPPSSTGTSEDFVASVTVIRTEASSASSLSSESSSSAPAEPVQKLAGTSLPSSGIGATVACLCAGMLAGVITIRRRTLGTA